MEVKGGYKQTEIGPIPPDWRLSPLGRLVSAVEYGSSAKSSSDGLMPVLRMGNLQEGKINWNDLVFTSSETEIRKYALRPGDVLFNRTNTIDLVGKTSIYRGEQPAIFAGYLIRVIADKSLLDSTFLNYVLNTEFARKYSAKVLSIAVGQANINGQKLKTYPIPLPPTKKEQEAIAGAISDADELIESLTALIAKKRNIKQGAMQELLTGRKRLPGYLRPYGDKETEVGKIPYDWNIKLLPEVCRFRGGKAHEQYVCSSGKFICVNSKFISTEGRVRKFCSKNFCPASRGDVLMVMSDLPNGNALAKAFLVDQDSVYAVNQRVCALTPYRDSSPYLFYALNRNRYFLKFDDGVNQTHLLNHVFAKCPLILPSQIDEQRAIAQTLSDIDAELESLESKLAKARQIKQGMMQELLTGRIRLV